MAAPRPLASRRDVVPAALASLRTAIHGDGPAGLVLRAPSGSGKTYLLDEIAEQVTVRSASARASEPSLGRPYDIAAELLGAPRPEPAPPAFAETLLGRLDDLVTAGPLLLVVDDLQFVDVESLLVLEQILAAATSVPVAMVASVRDGPARDELARFLQRSTVAVWDLPPFDLLDLDALVHHHTGAWPGPGARTLLAPVASNALHVLSVVDGLVAAGAQRGDLLDLPVHSGLVAESFEDTVARRVSVLQGAELDAARGLAVLAEPATIQELGDLLDVSAMSLLGPVQRLLDAQVLSERGTRVGFAHDAYRDAVYRAAPAPVRHVLHAAAGTRTGPAERARHLIAAGAGPDEMVAAVLAAADDLENAPGVTAELVASALQNTEVGDDAAAALAAARARALARSGRLRQAAEVAAAALPLATDPATLTDLHRVELFSLAARAQVPDAVAKVDTMLAWPMPDYTRRILTDHRTYMSLLGAQGPVPLTTWGTPNDLTLTGLVAEALRRTMLGDTQVGLEYALAASQQYFSSDADPNEGASADVWPPFVELLHDGPERARGTLVEVVRRREQRGSGWQTASHQAIGGAVDAWAGRLSDATPQLDAALESAAQSEMGWTSQPVGWRILIEVLQGDAPAASKRLAAWDDAPGGIQLGIPQVERARMALLEAERRYAEAALVAAQVWSTATYLRLHLWAATAAPDVMRVALRAADEGLRAQVGDALASMPPTSAVVARDSRVLAAAMAEASYRDLPDVAVDIADRAATYGAGLLRLTALEEAAVASAVTGDRDRARVLAKEAVATAEDFDARGVAQRIAGRMRSAGVRLGSNAGRSRPRHGWDSLTPTERLVVDHVARGVPGPDIARQLHLSPRTIQTHVSHVLAKLGLSNRVELAAYAVTQGAAAPTLD